MKVIRLIDLTGQDVLAGALAGAKLFASLAPLLPRDGDPAPLVVDFSGISVATASFLRESVVAFKSFARSRRSSWYPVVGNAAEEIFEELDVVCQARSDAMLTCEFTSSGEVLATRLAGHLDPKQREAFDYVMSQSHCTARELMQATATEAEKNSSPTAWNNRLNALVEKGVISESPLGRLKFYTPLLRSTERGN
jgi:hypothetical protein